MELELFVACMRIYMSALSPCRDLDYLMLYQSDFVRIEEWFGVYELGACLALSKKGGEPRVCSSNLLSHFYPAFA